MTEQVHVDLYMSVAHGTLRLVGHADIEKGTDEEVAGRIASAIHSVAWAFEDRHQETSVADDGHAPLPRMITNTQGDRFYEVAPDEFVLGLDFEGAIESYDKSGESDSFDSVMNLYPSSTWGYLQEME